MNAEAEKLMLETLLDLEWKLMRNANSVCPSCHSIFFRGHFEECSLARCLKSLDQQPKMIDRTKFPKGSFIELHNSTEPIYCRE